MALMEAIQAESNTVGLGNGAASDREIYERIATLKAVWAHLGNMGPASDRVAFFLLDRAFEQPHQELLAMRPKTVAGALAKFEYAKWQAEVSESDTPIEQGTAAVIADLKVLART